MSEGAAEGGGDGGGDAPISDGQFGDVTGTGDVPTPGPTAQDPGNGLFGYAWGVPHRVRRHAHLIARARKHRKRHR